MSTSIVCIKKIVTDISKLKREHFSENEAGYNEYGVLHEGKRALTRDERDIKTLLRLWIDERRVRGILYVLMNTRMWTVIALLCLLFFTFPFPKRVAFLNWIIPSVIAVCMPILSYLVFCIELEKRFIEMTGVNELGIQIDEVNSDVVDTTQAKANNATSLPHQKGGRVSHYITVGFIAYRSGGDYDEDDLGDDSDSDNPLTKKLAALKKSCEVAYLYVLPKYRRRGIGELLVETVCKDAIEESGYDMMYFAVPADTDRGAVEFVQSRGFRLVGMRARSAHRDTYNTKVETWIKRYVSSSKTSRGVTRISSYLRLALRAAFNPLSAGIVTLRSSVQTSRVYGPEERTSLSHQCKLALTGDGAEEDDLFARPLFKLDDRQLDILTSRKQVSTSIIEQDKTKSSLAPRKQVTFALDKSADQKCKDNHMYNEYEETEDDLESHLSSDYDDDDEYNYEQKLLRRRHLQRKMESSLQSTGQKRKKGPHAGFVPSSSSSFPTNLTFEEELEMIKNSVRHEERLKRHGASYLRSSMGRHNIDSEELSESDIDHSDTDSASFTVSGVWTPATSTSESMDTFSSYSGGAGRTIGKSRSSKAYFDRINRHAALGGNESATRYVETDTTKFMDDDQLNFLIRSNKHR